MKFSAVLFALFATALAIPTVGNDLARRQTKPDKPKCLFPLKQSCRNTSKCDSQNKLCIKTKKIDICGRPIWELIERSNALCNSLDTK